jgi:hypothetical protein
MNDPLSVSPETKQAESVVKLKFEIDNELSPLTFSDVPKVNIGDPPPLLVSVAFQVPLMLDEFEFEFEPQPISVRLPISNAAKANCFIEKLLGKSPKGREYLYGHEQAGAPTTMSCYS